MEAQGPFVGEGQFAVEFDFETTAKATGKRNRLTEMARCTPSRTDGSCASSSATIPPADHAVHDRRHGGPEA
jgi:hypothetical protein